MDYVVENSTIFMIVTSLMDEATGARQSLWGLGRLPTSGWRATWTSLRAEPPSCSSQVNKTTQSVSTLTEGRNLKFIFNISALAGILLKSENAYLFFFRTIFRTIWIIQIFCSAVSVSERFNFNSSAMERASGNYPFVCWRHWDEASECS